jgi:hypothetical protein
MHQPVVGIFPGSFDPGLPLSAESRGEEQHLQDHEFRSALYPVNPVHPVHAAKCVELARRTRLIMGK